MNNWLDSQHANGSFLDNIEHGDKVQILNYAGRGLKGPEWRPKWGKAVMRGPNGWVLNMGGKFGTPGIADERNITAVPRLKYKGPHYGKELVVGNLE